MEFTCAMIETLWDYCPDERRPWWRSTAHIGTKMRYLPSPEPRVWVVPISSILCRLPLVPLGDTGTILEGLNSNRQGRKDRSSYSGHYRQTALTVSRGEPVTVRALTPGPLSTGDTCRETQLSSFPSQTSDVQRLGFEQDRHR